MAAKTFKFETALLELEEITQWFESADVDLDASVAKFERGMKLAAELKDHLAQVQNRIETVRASFDPSAPQAPPFAEAGPDRKPIPDDLLD